MVNVFTAVSFSSVFVGILEVKLTSLAWHGVCIMPEKSSAWHHLSDFQISNSYDVSSGTLVSKSCPWTSIVLSVPFARAYDPWLRTIPQRILRIGNINRSKLFDESLWQDYTLSNIRLVLCAVILRPFIITSATPQPPYSPYTISLNFYPWISIVMISHIATMASVQTSTQGLELRSVWRTILTFKLTPRDFCFFSPVALFSSQALQFSIVFRLSTLHFTSSLVMDFHHILF